MRFVDPWIIRRMTMNKISIFMFLALCAGCNNASKITPEDWKAAHQACADHGGAQYLLRPDQGSREGLAVVCDDGQQEPIESP
jgi:hypothetical protein